MHNELKQLLLDLKNRFQAQWSESELDMWQLNYDSVDSLTDVEAETTLSKLKQVFWEKSESNC